jgi:hypothetical protein
MIMQHMMIWEMCVNGNFQGSSKFYDCHNVWILFHTPRLSTYKEPRMFHCVLCILKRPIWTPREPIQKEIQMF